MSRSFHLKKWYLDCVSDDGRALICYSARLTWLGAQITYASRIYLRAPQDTHIESRFHDVAEPAEEGDVMRWEDAGLQVAGQWTRCVPPLQAVLHETKKGRVVWNCVQPVSQCSIRVGDEPPMTGHGYVECLDMTVPPWEMGFNELRWGRFAHPDAPLVWIDLKGPTSQQRVFDGQTDVKTALVGEDCIHLPEFRKTLWLENPVVIEEKNKIMEVVRSLVAWLPGIEHRTPLRFLQARETKWRSWGKLEIAGQRAAAGWVIHELVTF